MLLKEPGKTDKRKSLTGRRELVKCQNNTKTQRLRKMTAY